MGHFKQSLTRLFTGAAKSFVRFPASMLSALVIAGSASYLIQIDQVSYSMFYQSLQMGFLVAGVLGLVIHALFRQHAGNLVCWIMNGVTLGLGGLIFWLINRSGDSIPELTIFRVMAASAVLFLLFVLIISRRGTDNDYSHAAFMTLKSAAIALLYSLVILLGLYFIAFSIQSLLLHSLSSKVYQHIGVWTAFLWFALFLGYFPNFALGDRDPQLELARRQPRFIEILFLYVLIPIMAALSIVLLIWTIQILIVGQWPDFGQLAAIFSGYAILGIWLFIMVSHNDLPAARWYRRLYPWILLLFLAFEAYALISRVLDSRFMTGEYVVMLVWIYAFLSALVLLIRPVAKNHLTTVAAMALMVIAVLPIVGYQDFTVASQSRRLYKLLTRYEMIVDARIRPAGQTLPDQDRQAISESALFLLRYQNETRIAPWFDESISDYSQFARVFGFEAYADRDSDYPNEQTAVFLLLPDGQVDLSDYQVMAFAGEMGKEDVLKITGISGSYLVDPVRIESGRSTVMTIRKEGQDFAVVDMQPFIEDLFERYKGMSAKEGVPIDFADMTIEVDEDGVRLLIVFQMIEINSDPDGRLSYFAQVRSVFLGDS